APTGPDDDGYMFRNVPDDEIQGIAMAYYLKTLRTPMVDSVAIVYEDTPYGTGLKNAFRTAFLDLGGTIITNGEIAFSQNLADELAGEAAIDALEALTPQPTVVILVAL